MKPEQQRIAIAEACGWKIHKDGIALRNPAGEIVNQHYGESWRLPDYLNDLNAMHEVEKILTAQQQFKYIQELINAPYNHMWGLAWDTGFICANATAAHRAEAFLRALGKWVEP